MHNVLLFVAELAPAEDKSSVKRTLIGCRKHTVKNKRTAADIGLEAEKAEYGASCKEKQKKRTRQTDVSMQDTSTSACKLFNIPQTELYECLLAKLKRPAYFAKMRKQLIKHKGKMLYGKNVICIARKKLVKVLSILDKIGNADSLKSQKRQTVRRLSKLLQAAIDL